jgi:hypothetical protein
MVVWIGFICPRTGNRLALVNMELKLRVLLKLYSNFGSEGLCSMDSETYEWKSQIRSRSKRSKGQRS